MASYLRYIDSAPYIVCRIHKDTLPGLNVHPLDQPLQHQHTAIAVLSMHLVRLMFSQCEIADAYMFVFLAVQVCGLFISGMGERWQGSRIITKALQSLYGAIFKIDYRYHARNLLGVESVTESCLICHFAVRNDEFERRGA